MSFSPEPWCHSETKDDSPTPFVHDAEGKIVAWVEGNWPNPARNDAALMAAAPTLLTFARKFVKWVDEVGGELYDLETDDGMQYLLAEARRAIAKADRSES